MEFDWDAAKAESNEIKHGVTFTEAQTVFDSPYFVDFYDPDHSDDEHRYIAVGESINGRLLIVCYTEIGETLRLISAREASRRERKAYEEG
jgi:hypothetical protein